MQRTEKNPEHMDGRLAEMARRMQLLEEKFAYQEKTVDDLNEVIIAQQAQLDLLQEQLRELREYVTAGPQPSYPSPGGDEPPPPHY